MLNVLKFARQYPRGHIRISLSIFLYFLTSFIRIYSHASYTILRNRLLNRKNRPEYLRREKINVAKVKSVNSIFSLSFGGKVRAKDTIPRYR